VQADLGDVTLEYDVLGSGPEVVWLHGLSGSLEESRPLCERLARDFRVLWYSTRGHGRSTAVLQRERYTYDAIATDLQGLLDHVGFARPVLAGGSHGANTILRHELRHPGRARAALLVAPGANALRRPPRPQWWLVRAHVRLSHRRGPAAFAAALTGDDELARAAFATHDDASIMAAMRHIADQRVIAPEALRGFDLPMLVAAWDRDPLIHPIAVARRIAELVPGARFQEIPRAVDLTPEQAGDLICGLLHEVVAGPP
jgi:3-oxoadipate enol-lactonase